MTFTVQIILILIHNMMCKIQKCKRIKISPEKSHFDLFLNTQLMMEEENKTGINTVSAHIFTNQVDFSFILCLFAEFLLHCGLAWM